MAAVNPTDRAAASMEAANPMAVKPAVDGIMVAVRKDSDQRIEEDVDERLTEHADIDASDIEVKVQGGEVTLTGTVNERHAKRIAEDVVESVMGVKQVHNQIRVQQQTESGTSSRETGSSTGGSRKTATSEAGQQHRELTGTNKR